MRMAPRSRERPRRRGAVKPFLSSAITCCYAKLAPEPWGAVYKAREIATGREVALEVLFQHVADNPKLLERFYSRGSHCRADGSS